MGRFCKYIDIVENPIIKLLCEEVVKDIRFWNSPGSCNKHHSWKHGLAQHTLEVMEIAFSIIDIKMYGLNVVNEDYIVCGILYHDYGKIFDYETKDDKITYTKHKYRIGHISKSNDLFAINADKLGLDEIDKDNIKHIILSHHGQLIYGSPVLPESMEARIVHCADMGSAFCDAKSPKDNNVKT